MNPATLVRGPKHSVKKGKTRVLAAEEARALLDSIETDRLIGLRDRALIGLMVYTLPVRTRCSRCASRIISFRAAARLGAVARKRGKLYSLSCHHNLDAYMEAYISAAGSAAGAKSPLFRTASNRAGDELTTNPLWQQDAYRMIQRRTKAARKPQLSGDSHHGVFEERRAARDRPADGKPRRQPHERPLRPPRR